MVADGKQNAWQELIDIDSDTDSCLVRSAHH